jgi:molybdopterin-guanine dinucleotide biosynthesis protein A
MVWPARGSAPIPEGMEQTHGRLAQPPLPLRACLLSGGASRRMGRDKALLPHPEGGTWLERQLRLLAGLGAPLTLLSGWPAHRERAAALVAPLAALGVELELLAESQAAPGLEPPWDKPNPDGRHGDLVGEASPGEQILQPLQGRQGRRGRQGPLVALGRLMEAHPDERLLLCPVDMPALTPACLRALLDAASAAPGAIWIAAQEDQTSPQPQGPRQGQRQPLLGLYPSDAPRRASLREALARGERGLQRWLAGEEVRTLPLPASALVNLNTPPELDRWCAGAQTTARLAREPL